MKRALLCLSILAACARCSSGSGSGSTGDDAGVDSGFQSNCGHPGDKGNSLGVGLFCQSVSDCVANTKATLCTTLGSTDNFFCTFACQKADPPDTCGENASCQCNDTGTSCGCFPDACGKPPEDDAGTDGGGMDGGSDGSSMDGAVTDSGGGG